MSVDHYGTSKWNQRRVNRDSSSCLCSGAAGSNSIAVFSTADGAGTIVCNFKYSEACTWWRSSISGIRQLRTWFWTHRRSHWLIRNTWARSRLLLLLLCKFLLETLLFFGCQLIRIIIKLSACWSCFCLEIVALLVHLCLESDQCFFLIFQECLLLLDFYFGVMQFVQHLAIIRTDVLNEIGFVQQIGHIFSRKEQF